MQHNVNMTTVLRVLVGFFAGLVVLVLGTTAAAACSCAALSTAEHAAEADVVARVVVERVRIPEMGANEDQRASYTMRPVHVWKGDVVSQFQVSSEVSGASCGLEGVTEGADLVVFATESNDGFSANLCGGTAPASQSLVVELLDEVGSGVAIDPELGDKPGEWLWPAITGAAALVVVGGLVLWWWVLPRHRR